MPKRRAPVTKSPKVKVPAEKKPKEINCEVETLKGGRKPTLGQQVY